MRLLKLDSSGNVAFTPDLQRNAIPPYAILSHTWGPDDEEVMFEDINSGRGKSKIGYEKIRFCVQQAKKDGLDHCWVDTCCINKPNLTELSEAINSMFRWYQESKKCYVYLSNVSSRKRDHEDGSQHPWEPAFRRCRWLTRGWTLQELLAPAIVEFYSREGDFLGDKQGLWSILEEAAGIPRSALCGEVSLSNFSVRDRMKWAASRDTTKPEDKVYCLLGIFNVFLQPIYGEGEKHAFGRLKEAIGKSYSNELDEISPALIRNNSFAPVGRDTQINNSQADRYKSLMNSLRFDQMDARQAHIQAAYSTTCTWLPQSPVYIKWVDANSSEQHRGFMWIKGKPGAGKSTLVKFACRHASKLKTKNEILISFFFNARGDELEKSTVGMYRSLLWQMLDKAKDIQPVFDDLPDPLQAGSTDWTIDTLRELFTTAVRRLGRRTLKCFIDALDECDEHDIRDMIMHLEDLGQMCPGRYFVCLASRHYPTIVVRHGVQLSLDDEIGHHDDLATYLHSHLRIDPGPFFDDILARALKKANGVFMWAVLVVPILNQEYHEGRSFAVQKRLNEIPDKLSELFKNILVRDSTNMDMLLLCLQWILFARNPLTREEFYFAMLAGPDAGGPAEWDQKVITQSDMDRFVHNSSKGLAELTSAASSVVRTKPKRARDRFDAIESTVRVQFIHESVRDFLIKDGGLCELWPELGADPASLSHDALKRRCQSYLGIDLGNHIPSFDQFPKAVQPDSTTRVQADLHTRFPFLRYATQRILYHAEQAATSTIQSEFLKSFPIKEWARVSNQFIDDAISRYSHSVGLLYILADHNAPNLIRLACRMGYQMESREQRFGHPFFAALVWHYWDAVRAILDPADKSDLDEVISSIRPYTSPKQCRKIRPFLWALQEGIKPLADFLVEKLDGNDSDCCDRERRSALSWAAERGYMETAERLISKGADVDICAREGLTPLLYAIRHGRISMVELLLDKGADCNLPGLYDENPIHFAAMGGLKTIGKLLLDRGARIYAKDREGNTALHLAVNSGSHGMVKMLVDCGASLDATDIQGRTALHLVAYSGCCDLARLLLDRRADVNAPGGYFGNALQAACALYKEHPVVVRIFREHRNIDHVRDLLEDEPPPEYDEHTRRLEIIKLLLEHGADANARGGYFGSALQAASAKGHEEIVQLLLDRGADVNAQGGHFGTALQAALTGAGDPEATVRLSDADTFDDTPAEYRAAVRAAHAVYNEHPGGVHGLVRDAEIDFDSPSTEDDELFPAVSSGRYQEVVQLLRRAGAR